MYYSQRLSGCPQGERKNPAGELSKNQKSERCEKLLYFDGVGADKKIFLPFMIMQLIITFWKRTKHYIKAEENLSGMCRTTK